MVSPAKLKLLREVTPNGYLRLGYSIDRDDTAVGMARRPLPRLIQLANEMLDEGLLEKPEATEWRSPIGRDTHVNITYEITAAGRRAAEFAAGKDGAMKVIVEFDLNTREGKMKVGDKEYFVFVDDATIRDNAYANMASVSTMSGRFVPQMVLANPRGMDLDLKLRASETPPTPSTSKPLDFGTGREVDIEW